MHYTRKPIVHEADNSGRNEIFHINPIYETTLSFNRNVEANDERNNGEEDHELDRISYREMIRMSIQLPENTRRKKHFRFKLLRKDHKEERLFIAYMLLISLFVMTFCLIGISIVMQTASSNLFPACWTSAVALAFLTVMIGLYICWEDDICKSHPSRQKKICIDLQLTTSVENL